MRRESKSSARLRMKDTFEFLESAKDNFNKKRFKSAILDCGDAVIAANDAFTIYTIGEMATRHHQEAIILHKKAGIKINENMTIVLQNMLNIRHQRGYRPVTVSKSLAKESIMNATKFVNWVKEKIEEF